MTSADHARAIARAIVSAAPLDTPRPFASLAWGAQQAIRAEADRLGVAPEALYEEQTAALSAHVAQERQRIAQEDAFSAAVRGGIR
ncbi:hypothetical protein [Curtobacterium sp. MCBD17_019]|uniref:hypothetical protein n=1 Tax=Curtobacterium sp. MCBD17_019 TaxID=2175669 RepID=UPI000DA8051E|nr:hypothetical protein [Curtobacterium sp. MCBD17_019]PZE71620.1 hypothetical protein DEI82_15140 [Curtobacterium sp. MCBD17_019]